MKIKRSRGLTTPVVATAIISLGMLAMGTWAMRGRAVSHEKNSKDLHTVTEGSFDIRIPALGELAALKQIEIKNQLESRAVITEVAEEGSMVKKGDLLVKFNDEEIRNRVREAEEAVTATKNELEGAKAELEIKKKTSESEIEKAQLKVEIADLSLNSWRYGEVVTKRKQLELAKQKAVMNHSRLVDRFEATKRLYEQEFISLDQYKTDEISLVDAKATLEQTALDSEVYEKYTYETQRKQKESDFNQSQKEFQRVNDRQKAEVIRAESHVFSATRHLTSRETRLKRLEGQLEHCVINAPQDGLVVYASSLNQFSWMRMSGKAIQVGTELWREQMVMVLPDTSQMVAEVKVNEALTGSVEPGQKATIVCDISPDNILTGVVESIGVLASSSNWQDPNRRDYTVRIKIDGGNELGLKPSMRCNTDIFIGHVENALFVPIQSVFRQGANIFVYVPQGRGYAQVKVKPGKASEMYIEILQGLEVGQQVLTREPRTEEIVFTLPEEEDVEAEEPKSEKKDKESGATGVIEATEGGAGAGGGGAEVEGEAVTTDDTPSEAAPGEAKEPEAEEVTAETKPDDAATPPPPDSTPKTAPDTEK